MSEMNPGSRRLAQIHNSLTITRADCESERKLNCEDCPTMPGCHVALAIIDCEVLRGADLVDVGQAKGELMIADVMLRDMDWERLAREHPELIPDEMEGSIRWRVRNALHHLGGVEVPDD